MILSREKVQKLFNVFLYDTTIENTPDVTKIVLPKKFYKNLRRRQIVPVGPMN